MTEALAAKILFGLYTLIILGGGVLAVSAKSMVRALVGLITALFGTAGLYLLMNAPFMALMQILIYVGAVAVLIFFAIMLTRGEDEGESAGTFGKIGLMAGAALLPAILAVILTKAPLKSIELPVEIDIAVLGEGLLGQYVLAFELISVVLFVAMAGAVVLGYQRRDAR